MEPIIKKNLEDLKKELKEEFFGIDFVIDDICDMIVPWHRTPKLLRKPIIISLWGMTGCGKTSLVRKIAEKLNRELVEIDVGKYTTTAWWDFGNSFFEKFHDASQKNPIILLDEFHMCKTKNEMGNEIDRPNIRSLWSLLSDGQITMECDDFDFPNFFESCRKMYYTNIETNKQSDEKKESNPLSIRNIFEESNNKINYVFENHLFEKISKLLGVDMKNIIKNMENDFITTIKNLEEISKERFPRGKQLVIDLSKSLIFVSGNLDNIYLGDDEYNRESNIEYFYKYSLNIKSVDIIKELSNIFRKEQIGRLGNNYIIYPALNENAYRKIIDNELNEINKHYKLEYNLNFNFDKTVKDILFEEGVAPAQGARSVLSIISSFLESNISNFIANNMSKEDNPIDINVFFNKKKSKFIYESYNNYFSLKTKIRDAGYTKGEINETNVLTAVHEAGHVVASILENGVIPQSANIFLRGIGLTKFPFIPREVFEVSYESQLNIIKVLMGGWAAEYVVFGENHQSLGSSKDIKDITKIIYDLVDDHGFGRIIKKSRDNSTDSKPSIRSGNDENLANSIVEDLKQQTIITIKKNKLFLIDISKAILRKSKINSKDIKNIMKKHHIIPKEKFSYKKLFLQAVEDISNSKSIITKKGNIKYKKPNIKEKILI